MILQQKLMENKRCIKTYYNMFISIDENMTYYDYLTNKQIRKRIDELEKINKCIVRQIFNKNSIRKDEPAKVDVIGGCIAIIN